MLCEHVGDAKPECLHSVEALVELAGSAEQDQLIEPRVHLSELRTVESHELEWLGIEGRGQFFSVVSVAEQRGMLPEHLIDRIVRVDRDRRECDPPIRVRTAQHARADHHCVAGTDASAPELSEQVSRAVEYEREPHALDDVWPLGPCQ
ncbi:MAG: hypothetical protein QM695_00320 [Micropruina sp.]